MKIDKSKSPDRNRPWKDYGFDETKIDLTAGGKSDQLTLCPECSANRSKRKKHKCCSINVDYGVWHCHHCNASGYVPTRRELDARNQVLAVTREAVVRRGIRILVLAPPQLHHARRRGQGAAPHSSTMWSAVATCHARYAV